MSFLKTKNPLGVPLMNYLGLLIYAVCLISCASAPSADPSGGGLLPPVAGQIPTEYALKAASEAARPGWIMETPEESGGLHYLVGLSDYHTSEKAARSDALRNGREEYAKYTGVDVSVVDEVIRSLYGKSSAILDATVARQSHSTQTTDARISRVRAKKWYSETYQVNQGRQSRGIAYKYWVLVTVPIDEIERVQAWKETRERQADERAEVELKAILKRVDETLDWSQKELAVGNIVQVLSRIHQDWNHLYTEIERFKKGDPYHQTRVLRLEQTQKNLVAEIGNIRSRLFLDTGRFGTQTINTRGGSGKVRVWVWLRSGERKQPVSGLPLVLKGEKNGAVLRATSGPRGRADFMIGRGIEPGLYRVAIDSETGPLALLGDDLCRLLAMCDNRLSLIQAGDDMTGAVQAAIHSIFEGPSLVELPVKKVALAPVTYAESRQASGFGRTLTQIIREQLTAVEGLAVIEPRPRNAQLVSDTVRRVRGITLETKDEDTGVPPPTSLGSAAMQAAIDGADAALEVTYTIRENREIWAAMKLKEAGTNVLIEAATAVIRNYHAGLELVPPMAAQPPSPPSAGDIRLEVTSQLGDGRTYQAGEIISYFVSTSQDAHLLLIYEDATHNLIQILPNKYSGNEFYRAGKLLKIPGPKDRFEFVIEAPYGVEYLRAYASTRPFPTLPGRELGNGLRLLSAPLERISATIRRHGAQPGNHYGEAMTVITTVAKR